MAGDNKRDTKKLYSRYKQQNYVSIIDHLSLSLTKVRI